MSTAEVRKSLSLLAPSAPPFVTSVNLNSPLNSCVLLTYDNFFVVKSIAEPAASSSSSSSSSSPSAARGESVCIHKSTLSDGLTLSLGGMLHETSLLALARTAPSSEQGSPPPSERSAGSGFLGANFKPTMPLLLNGVGSSAKPPTPSRSSNNNNSASSSAVHAPPRTLSIVNASTLNVICDLSFLDPIRSLSLTLSRLLVYTSERSNHNPSPHPSLPPFSLPNLTLFGCSGGGGNNAGASSVNDNLSKTLSDGYDNSGGGHVHLFNLSNLRRLGTIRVGGDGKKRRVLVKSGEVMPL